MLANPLFCRFWLRLHIAILFSGECLRSLRLSPVFAPQHLEFRLFEFRFAISITLPKTLAVAGGLSGYYALHHPPPFFGWFCLRLRPIGEHNQQWHLTLLAVFGYSLCEPLISQPFAGNAVNEAIKPRECMVLHVALVKPERKFIDVAIKMLWAGVVINANDPAFSRLIIASMRDLHLVHWPTTLIKALQTVFFV
jgi:hypothetical protein